MCGDDVLIFIFFYVSLFAAIAMGIPIYIVERQQAFVL